MIFAPTPTGALLGGGKDRVLLISSSNGMARVPARIVAVKSFLPERVLDNEQLANELGNWSADKILDKTGIAERRVVGEDQTALDIAEGAARALLDEVEVVPDFLIFCTQAPDYFLPTSACILQHRLGLPNSIGALDINLGCSGYVYGLALATGLIASGAARRVLLLTADTYTKFIHPQDRSVRTLFGDAGTASLIEAAEEEGACIGPFVFGTDGAGARDLMVEAGGARLPRDAETAVAVEDAFGNVRSAENLFMNGSAVLSFTLREVPKAFDALIEKSGVNHDDFEYVILHQANKFMLETLRKKLRLPKERVPYFFEHVGNTVSSTIPLVLEDLLRQGRLTPGTRYALLGFGVGLSWAGVSICA